jgi:hypothetical protein
LGTATLVALIEGQPKVLTVLATKTVYEDSGTSAVDAKHFRGSRASQRFSGSDRHMRPQRR